MSVSAHKFVRSTDRAFLPIRDGETYGALVREIVDPVFEPGDLHPLDFPLGDEELPDVAIIGVGQSAGGSPPRRSTMSGTVLLWPTIRSRPRPGADRGRPGPACRRDRRRSPSGPAAPPAAPRSRRARREVADIDGRGGSCVEQMASRAALRWPSSAVSVRIALALRRMEVANDVEDRAAGRRRRRGRAGGGRRAARKAQRDQAIGNHVRRFVAS